MASGLSELRQRNVMKLLGLLRISKSNFIVKFGSPYTWNLRGQIMNVKMKVMECTNIRNCGSITLFNQLHPISYKFAVKASIIINFKTLWLTQVSFICR